MKSSARGIAPIMVLLMVLMAGRKGEASVERPHSDGTKKMLRVVGTGLAGVAVVYGLGFAANAFVPLAMTKCGVVAKGVGTLHASYAAGGLAAKLQAFAHVVLQKKAVLKVLGASVRAKKRLPKLKNLLEVQRQNVTQTGMALHRGYRSFDRSWVPVRRASGIQRKKASYGVARFWLFFAESKIKNMRVIAKLIFFTTKLRPTWSEKNRYR